MKNKFPLVVILSLFMILIFNVSIFAVNINDVPVGEPEETFATQEVTVEPTQEPVTDVPTEAPTAPPTDEPWTEPATYEPTTEVWTNPPTDTQTEYETNYSFSESETYAPTEGYTDVAPTTPTHFEANTEVDTHKADKSDWDIDINNPTTNKGDFSQIKNNKSTEDVSNKWMLYTSWGLIGISAIGIIAIIIFCINKSKKIKEQKLMLADGDQELNFDVDTDNEQAPKSKRSSKKNAKQQKTVYIPRETTSEKEIDDYDDNF